MAQSVLILQLLPVKVKPLVTNRYAFDVLVHRLDRVDGRVAVHLERYVSACQGQDVDVHVPGSVG